MQANWLAVVEPSIRKIYESVNSDGEGGLGGGVQRSGENRVEAGGARLFIRRVHGQRGRCSNLYVDAEPGWLIRDLMWLPD